MRYASAFAPILLACALPAQAFEPLSGHFVASRACDAYLSKNERTNPGDVETVPKQAYDILGLNRADGEFYQIRIPDAPVTGERWVHVDCGRHVAEAENAAATRPPRAAHAERPAGRESDHNLLALSWQPAFCEKKPYRTECEQLNDGSQPSTATLLSIHGLWPQPRDREYCGVSDALKELDRAGRWRQLPALDLDSETREALNVAMPGTASFLHRHEWIKHGTCQFGDGGADEYYRDTLMVTEAISTSVVGSFLADNLGAEVRTADIRTRFDQAFGRGAGNRVEFLCAGDHGRVLIQGFKINLRGVIRPDSDVSELILAGDTVPIGCRRGVIDPAGLQ